MSFPKEKLRYAFEEGFLHITSSTTFEHADLLAFFIDGERDEYDEVFDYLGYLKDKKAVVSIDMNARALTVSATLSAPIDQRVLLRHCMLHALWSDDPLVEWLAELGEDYNADEELVKLCSPYWKDYDDLLFAQVLVTHIVESACNVADKPWEGDRNMGDMRPEDRVASPEQFRADVRAWADACCKRYSDLVVNRSRLEEVATAALNLEPKRLRQLLQADPWNRPGNHS